MKKALEILDYFRSEQIAYGCTPFLLEMYNEAIAELEAMKPKTCEGCKTCEHYSSGKQSDNFGWEKCGWDWECKRKYDDRYEPKDNK